MRAALKSLLFAMGAARALHRWRNRRMLTTVMFHRVLPPDDPRSAGANPIYTVSTGEFSRCLDFFARFYSVIDLPTLERAAKGAALPPCPLLITFDDGWQDNAQYALPELKARGMPALLFLATGYVGSENGFWQEEAFTRGGAALVDELAALAPKERLARLAALPAPALPRRMVNESELRQLRDGGVAIGGHGDSHEPLTSLDAPEEELRRCRARLAELDPAHPRPAFSFPHGRTTPALLKAVRAAGFGLCFTSAPWLARPDALAGPEGIGRISVELERFRRADGFDLAALAFSLITRPHGPVAR